MKKPTIAYCGLTHLGLCSMAAAVSKKFKVIGYDNDNEKIKKLINGDFKITEPNLINTLKSKKYYLKFTNNINDINHCDIIYISLDVETSSTGESDLNKVQNLISKVINNLKQPKIIVILSQVYPGFTRNILAAEHQLFYQVETLIFGNALQRAINPERIIVGSSQPNELLPKKYFEFLSSFKCDILNMKYESAELTKISINLFLWSQVTTANKLAEICEKIDANWYEIVPALRLDKRIGKHAYLLPGLGVSGGNLERDLTSISNLSKKLKIDCALFKSFSDISKVRKNWVIEILFANLKEGERKRIGILGLSYKENTNSLKNAPSLDLIPMLEKQDLIVYDPVVNVKDKFAWCHQASCINNVITNAEILIILTPWNEFKELDLSLIKKQMLGNIIIDPYKIFDEIEIKKNNLIQFSLGK